MATPAQDLRDKLKLEAQLRPQIRKYNNKIIREFARQYKFDGNILNVNLFDDELNEILSEHYKKTNRLFSDRIRPNLPDDVTATDEESNAIEAALAIYFLSKASETTKEINNTNRNELIESVNQANEDELTEGLTGTERTIVVATVASAFANRKFNGRVDTIATTETQLAAETAKATEAEVLSGLQPSITGGSPVQVDVNKRWVTVGDSRVRPAHVSADFQERKLTQPYEVGGELLRWPRDRDLGASPGNVINCRCSSTIFEKDIIKKRRE